ncbi:hypothetical protein GPA25_18835 [Aromatoleum diolicum]|uniref:Uncharacterized protein n=1 Tax=Aromatoleum diolicum TaxID=75796 RepID=A0ABX1QFT3_9RHOO|nr:hypothetical protein [Aromatoleum diolicum]
MVWLLAIPPAPPVIAQTAAQPSMNPAQAAFVAAASRRIEDHFVSEVARITGTSPARVRKAMPDERRITSAASRLISALEVDLGAPLSAEQQAAILDADQARKLSLAKAREAAAAQH